MAALGRQDTSFPKEKAIGMFRCCLTSYNEHGYFVYPKVSKSTDNRMEAFEAFANCIGLSSELISDGASELGDTRTQSRRFMVQNHIEFHATKRAYQSLIKAKMMIRFIMTCTKLLISEHDVPKRLWDL